MQKWFSPILSLCAFLFFNPVLHAQSVSVSSYFNAADQRDEWIELIVMTDNTDMRNWTIRDNNSSQNSWQTAVSFNNIAFWNNMRSGTIIMIWNRPVTSDGVTAHPQDVNKNDGYIELSATNTTYFGGGTFGTAPAWGGASLNFAGTGDVVQLRDASGTHVHALGHMSSPGTDWTALPSPKLNHANSANSGDAIYVCGGANQAQYGTSTPQNGTTWTSKNSGTLTFGLPNISGSSPIQNTAYWDTLREPVFSNQVVAPSVVVAGNPGSLSFSWTAAVDPNVADGTTGYLILQNTVNAFTAPADGTTYTTGATLGTATVLAQIPSSATTTYTDNTVMNGNSYYYRVYAYRYTTDNTNGNTYHRARGRAYSSTFVDVQQVNPLPVELLEFTGAKKEQTVFLQWTTASELNNAYFTVERSANENAFTAIGTVQGNGTCSQQHFYSLTDETPAEGMNYYRLRQNDYNGVFQYSNVIAVAFETEKTFSATCFMSDGNLTYVTESEAPLSLLVTDLSGRIVYEETGSEKRKGSINAAEWREGIYIVRISNGKDLYVSKVLR